MMMIEGLAILALGSALGGWIGYKAGGSFANERLAKADSMLADATKELRALKVANERELASLRAQLADGQAAWKRTFQEEGRKMALLHRDAELYSLREEAKAEEALLKAQLEEASRLLATEQANLDGVLASLASWQTTLAAVELERARTYDEGRAAFLQVSSKAQAEVAELNRVAVKLSNPLPLYRAIFELFYRAPLKELVARAGVSKVGGIYSICHEESGRRYVGQSVDVGERWLAHAKRGCGAEVGTLAGGKLYAALMEEGLWSFRWELLEEVADRTLLSPKEAYWIDRYAAVETGYNSKRGG